MKFNSTEKLHDLCGSILSLNVGNTLLLCYCHSIVMKPEKAMAPHSSTLAWRTLDRSLVGCRLWALIESDTTEVN